MFFGPNRKILARRKEDKVRNEAPNFCPPGRSLGASGQHGKGFAKRAGTGPGFLLLEWDELHRTDLLSASCPEFIIHIGTCAGLSGADGGGGKAAHGALCVFHFRPTRKPSSVYKAIRSSMWLKLLTVSRTVSHYAAMQFCFASSAPLLAESLYSQVNERDSIQG